jgi:hypothetical protein
MSAIIPGQLMAAIHHMLAVKKTVPAIQLKKKADFCDLVREMHINQGASPTQAR